MYRGFRNPTPERSHLSNSRTPLYPIGPTLNHTSYQPIYEVPKKFQSFANNTLPSYQERLMEKQSQLSRAKIPREELQRQLITNNEAEVENENRRRRLLQDSYVREIERVQIILNKNEERKNKLVSETELLEKDSQELRLKVEDAANGIPKYSHPDGLERKQLEVMELKTHMLNEIRTKEEELLRQKQTQFADWQDKVKEKQNILIATEEKRNAARNQLLRIRRECDSEARTVPSSVSDMARGRKHQQFKYDFDVLAKKVAVLSEERRTSQREVDLTAHNKRIVIRDQYLKLQGFKRLRLGLEENIKEIELRNKQLERSNQNMEEQNNRNQSLIIQYQSDIEQTRAKASTNDAEINARLNKFRQRESRHLMENTPVEIEDLQRKIREVQNDSFRLRADFKKLTDFLESEVTKTIYQTFNDVRVT